MWTDRTISTALLFAVVCCNVCAQETLLRDGTTLFEGHPERWYADLSGRGQHGSNAFHAGLADKFLFGGFIDEDMKNQLSSNLTTHNTLAWEWNLRASLTYLIDSTWGVIGSVSRTQLQRVEFSENAAELLFRGNTHFSDGVTVVLRDESWSGISFDKYQVGAVDVQSGSYIKLGLYRGLDLSSWQLPKGNLIAQEIDVGGLMVPDQIAAGVAGLEGRNNIGSRNWGLGIDLFGALRNEWGTFTVAVQDLGVIRWGQIESRDTSGTFSFSGFDLFSESVSGNLIENLVDSIQPLGISEANAWRLLPVELSIGFISRRWKEKFFVAGRVFHRFGLHAYPGSEISGNYAFAKESFLWASISHSDFAPLQWGVGVQATLLKKSLINVYTFHLPGFMTHSTLSRSIGIQWIQRI